MDTIQEVIEFLSVMDKQEYADAVSALRARTAELEPLAECAAIMAVCGYFSRMRGPDCYKVFADNDYVYIDDGVPCGYPSQNITPLYAGSAPVPAAPAEAKVADDVQVALDRLLDGAWWPSTIEPCVAYARLQDDTDGEFTLDHTLSIVFSRDGDAWLNVPRAPHSLRFRTYAGGGMSLRVRNALLVLAEAVRRDNEERPQIPSAMLAAKAKEN